ncbi:MAG: hypothetical protein JXQ69_07085 [Paludibacteraceae bacterium]|nr:hypothetical protein [Paludibacteraceae bacterium]
MKDIACIYLCTIWDFLSDNYDWIIGLLSIIISVIIAYHIYSLSKKLSTKEKLTNIKLLKNLTKEIISEVYTTKGSRKKVIIINLNQIEKYPNGCTTAGFIKDATYNGVEVFLPEIRKIYRTKHNKFTLKSRNNKFHCEVQVVGVIPYKWIEYIEPHGDEYNSCALRIFCRFKNYKPYVDFSFHKNLLKLRAIKYMFKINLYYFSPYINFVYYTKNQNYIEGENYYWEQYHFFCNEKELRKIKLTT